MVLRFALNGLARIPVRLQQRCLSNKPASSLVELGRILKPNAPATPYKPGNFFIHRQLGYRGVVVDKWTPAVHTFPNISSDEVSANISSEAPVLRDLGSAAIHSSTFYQVFCDSSDAENENCGLGIQSWTHDSGLTGEVDYVDHNDIIPFSPAGNILFRNGLHALYFRRRSAWAHEMAESLKFHEKSILTSDYGAWEQLTKKSLGQSKVFRAKTDDVQVTVIPFFEQRAEHSVDPSNPFLEKPFVWFYQVLIENQGPVPMQLVSRRWHIRDEHGNVDSVSGQGVVSMMPILAPHSRAFQYMSSITLGTASGLMGGSFALVELLANGQYGRTIDVSIPTFQLNSPAEASVVVAETDLSLGNVHRVRKDDDPRF